jgi:TolB-like protein/predicted Zn-dependent protease
MPGDNGMWKSSKDEVQSSSFSAAPTPRPVFISYASADAPLAQKVCAALEAGGFLCWIAPRNVVPGTLYAEGIVRALDESTIVVLILSEQAVASAHVGKELERATSKRHPIIALRIDTAPLTPAFEYFLNESQWIEVGAGGTDAAIAQLVGAVGQHLSPRSASASTHSPQAPTTKPKPAMPRRVWVIAGFIVVLALAVAYFMANKTWFSKHVTAKQDVTATPAVVRDKSIAVLPFVDMSEKKDQEYFADGMAEEIINLLVKVPGLKVIGRTSSFQFKGKAEDLRSIGTQLGVAYVLEGSVRKSGDHLRVTAQLINSREGTHLWSQTYDRDLSDVLKMQDEIAASLVRALQVEVGSAYGIVSRPMVRNTEAYNLYLQGAHANERFDQQGFEQAASYYQRALDLDPTFANAAAGIAAAYDNLGEFLMMPPAAAFEQARHAAEHALTLDPKNAFARALLGNIHNVYDWAWTAAERELRLARELSPNDSFILYMCGKQLLTAGSWNDALKLVNALLEADPLNPLGYELLKDVQVRRGRLAEAEVAIRRSLEISPTYSFGHYSVGIVLLTRNEPEAALAEFSKEPIDGGRVAGSALAYFALGAKADSDAALAQMLKNYANIPSAVASVFAFRGESDEAFKWLDRAYEQKDPLLYRIKVSPEFDKLHGDPRYKAFLRKMNLPEG